MFKGYCFFEDGSHTEAVNLKNAEEAVRYVLLQKGIQHEVRIVDENDFIVMHAIRGEVVFPKIEKAPTADQAK